jgi:hypothetical protein
VDTRKKGAGKKGSNPSAVLRIPLETILFQPAQPGFAGAVSFASVFCFYPFERLFSWGRRCGFPTPSSVAFFPFRTADHRHRDQSAPLSLVVSAVAGASGVVAGFAAVVQARTAVVLAAAVPGTAVDRGFETAAGVLGIAVGRGSETAVGIRAAVVAAGQTVGFFPAGGIAAGLAAPCAALRRLGSVAVGPPLLPVVEGAVFGGVPAAGR